ncbi:MAG: hypothetical protein QF466_07460 [Desulfobacterales bacterium]|jgi:hypothetical protein|nr:hypothetical protein [Desulfobacter sp.]MDP6395269.1 hypothetical protein [Desulfobacterales bacterium]MDP6683592.1 hypothetical protein [Desulfobacterales bacterium]MDP6807923.1 hypothetical protein [Desulfobacterales bacterium]|tara:strand:+ start:52256 stop:52528 length:273 start_codon:yes stop_codon:yes gene_type:complete
MTKEKKTAKVKGGFRSTLALLISIIALIVAVIAYNRTGGDMDMQKQLNELQGTMEKMKGETSKGFGKFREETSKALDKLSKMIKGKETAQ